MGHRPRDGPHSQRDPRLYTKNPGMLCLWSHLFLYHNSYTASRN